MKERTEPWTGKEFAVLAAILAVSLCVLVQPRFLPAFDALAEADERHTIWAEAYNRAKVQFPNVPDAEVTRIADAAIAEAIATGEFSAAVTDRAAAYRSAMQNSDGVPYLLHPDAYLYLRYAEEVLRNGMIGEPILENPGSVDPLRHAPLGEPINQHPLPYLLAAFARAIPMVVPAVSTIGAMALYPLIAGALLLLMVYGLLRKIAGVTAAQIGMGFLAVHPQLFAAFQWGYLDTNALNVLCSAALSALAYYAATAVRWRNAIAAAVAAVLAYAAFDAAWSPAVFFGIAAMGIGVAVGLVRIWPLLTRWRWRVAIPVVLTLGVGVVAYLLRAQPITETALRYFGGGSAGGILEVFPYISEARALGIMELFSAIGGTATASGSVLQFFGSLVVLLMLGTGMFMLCRKIRDPRMREGAVFVLLWFAVLAYPATRLRFLQFAIIPIAMGIGIGAAWWTTRIAEWIPRRISLRTQVGRGAVVLGLALAVIPGTIGAIRNANPVMNDALTAVAERIAADSPTDAIIATWWNEGYLYQYAAGRATYFDGASVESLDAYWLSRYLLESDRKIARRILQGMSCEEYALHYLIEAFPTNTMVHAGNMLQKDRAEAETYLREIRGERVFTYVDGDEKRPIAEFLFPRLYCDTPRATYVVISEAHLGTIWAFDWYRKTDLANPAEGTSGRSELNGVAFACNTVGTQIICEYGLTVNLERGTASGPYGERIPFFLNDGTHLYRPQEDVPPNRPVLILYIDGDRLRGVLINSDILNSMLVKLLFFNGEGMPEYEKIAEAAGPYQARIVAYRVNFTTEI